MRTLASVVLVLGSFGLFGCGGSGDADKAGIGDDRKQLATLLTDFNDTGSAVAMTPYFVAGSKVTPAEHKKYISMVYEFEKPPEVSGTTATGTVKMKSSGDGKEMGSKEWTFAKEGEKWKLKSAPLP